MADGRRTWQEWLGACVTALACVGLTLGAVLGILGAGASAAAARTGVYWGATAAQSTPSGDQWAPWAWTAFTSFEQDAGKDASLLNWGTSFCVAAACPNPYEPGDAGDYDTFAAQLASFDEVRADGAIPFFTWASDSGYTDAQIAAGGEDVPITAWAQAAAAWGHPFFLRFDWEMNGNWFPWGVGVDGNTAADYVAMWRHVYDIFQSVGATNVTFVWCPNVDPQGGTEPDDPSSDLYSPLANLYPGDQYVGWTCLDGYNYAGSWASWRSIFAPTYTTITTRGELSPGASAKPMMIAETGSQENTAAQPTKAGWITGMFDSLPFRFPDIHGLMWFNVPDANQWPIESSPAAQAAFAAGVRAPRYVTNRFSALADTGQPIAPPSIAAGG